MTDILAALTDEEIGQSFIENQRKVEDDQENGYEPEQISVSQQQTCEFLVILKGVLELWKWS